jgi:hypothetical protein
MYINGFAVFMRGARPTAHAAPATPPATGTTETAPLRTPPYGLASGRPGPGGLLRALAVLRGLRRRRAPLGVPREWGPPGSSGG